MVIVGQRLKISSNIETITTDFSFCLAHNNSIYGSNFLNKRK